MGININKYLTPPVILIASLLIISLMIIFPVLNMIILGAILAYGIRPVANKFQSKLKYSSISILMAIIVVLIPLILLFGYLIYETSTLVSWVLANNSYSDVNQIISDISKYLP